MAPASASLASPGGPSHASAPVMQMVVEAVDLKLNLSTNAEWFGVKKMCDFFVTSVPSSSFEGNILN